MPKKLNRSRSKSPQKKKSRSNSPKGKSWVIYTKKGCPYCEKAKDLLETRKTGRLLVVNGVINGKPIQEINEIMKDIGKEDFKTWPKIFFNGKFIGGYTDLEKMSHRI